MGRERKPPTGHMTVRCPVEVHGELIEMADALGIDLSSLCYMMINELRPVYLDKARKLLENVRQSRTAFDQAFTGADHPKVAHLVLIGRQSPPEERLNALAKAVRVIWTQGDPSPATLVEAAEKLLREEDLRQKVRTAVEATSPAAK